jgi:purine-nucleoside phosphorylase
MSAPADLFDRVVALADAVRARAAEPPRGAIVLGSGLGDVADDLENATSIPYAELPGFPRSTVAGHEGRLVLGRLASVPVAVLQGRAHAYEGVPAWQVALPVRVLAHLGARFAVLTNAAGAVRADLEPGQLLCIRDHLNLSGQSPLTGPDDERLGPRFPDLSRAWDPALREAALAAAAEVGVSLATGVYAGVAGPAYETPAEIAMLRTLGADAVGMSTVPEAIALAHMGVRTAGLSCITNRAAGMGPPLSHEEVSRVAKASSGELKRLLSAFIHRADLMTGVGVRV